MKKLILLLLFICLPSFAQTYTVTFRDSILGKYAGYPDGRIVELCFRNVLYLMTDSGHLIVAVDQQNRPIACQLEEKKSK